MNLINYIIISKFNLLNYKSLRIIRCVNMISIIFLYSLQLFVHVFRLIDWSIVLFILFCKLFFKVRTNLFWKCAINFIIKQSYRNVFEIKRNTVFFCVCIYYWIDFRCVSRKLCIYFMLLLLFMKIKEIIRIPMGFLIGRGVLFWCALCNSLEIPTCRWI